MDLNNLTLTDVINYGGLVVGIVLALLGIVVSIYTYRVSKETKEPRFYYSTHREVEKISAPNSRIHVFFDSAEVERVYTTYVWFWNEGKKPILASDVPAQDPLGLKFVNDDGPVTILGCRLVKRSSSAINPRVNTLDKGELSVKFEFLDYRDGFLLEVQHTGDFSTTVHFEGVILGSAKRHKITPDPDPIYLHHGTDRNYTHPGWGKKIFGMSICALGLSGAWYFLSSNSGDMWAGIIPAAILGLGGIIFGLGLLKSPFPFPRELDYDFEEKHNVRSLIATWFARLFDLLKGVNRD